MTESLLIWLAAYLAHSTVLLAGAWTLERTGRVRTPASRELMWRFAVLAGIVTASAQTLWPASGPGLAASAPERPANTGVADVPTVAVQPMATVRKGQRTVVPSSATAPSTPALALPQIDTAPTWMLPAAVRAPAPWLVAFWMLLGLLGIARLAVMLSLRQSELSRMRACHAEPLASIARRLSDEHGLSAPRLVLDPASSSPTVNLGGVLTLPAWAADANDPRTAEAMLAHELGHIARHDAHWRLLMAAVKAVLWCQPLNASATRRLEALAELGADDWALRATGNPRALAECLARCAQQLPQAPAPALAVAMAGSSPLVTRIERLLKENTMKSGKVHPGQRLLVAVAMALGIAVLPTIAIAPVSAGSGSHIQIGDSWFSGSYSKVKVDERGIQLAAEIRGEARFSDAEDDIVSLGSGDEAWIEQHVDGVKRRIEFEDRDGKVVRRYFVDGREQPIDATAKAWLRTAIPLLLRESGIDAEARVGRLHKRGGANAVLQEVALIGGSYTRRVYIAELAELGALAPAELDRAIALAGAIDGDFERREALVALLENQELTPANQLAVLGAVASMGSDFEARTVLVELSGDMSGDEAVATAWGKALAAIGSDFERRTAIVEVVERRELPPALLRVALEAIGTMKSDFEQRTALSAMAPHLEGNVPSAVAYARAATTIASDFERRSALVALPHESFGDATVARAVIDATEGMQSSFERRQVLVAVASEMPPDAALIERYRQVARSMDSFERGQAEEALDRLYD